MIAGHPISLYLLSVGVSFVSVFLKGFQHKNVIGNHIKTVAVTSYFMAAFDVAAVYIIIHGGWWVALTAGTGAAIGMVVAMKSHDFIFGWVERQRTKKASVEKPTQDSIV